MLNANFAINKLNLILHLTPDVYRNVMKKDTFKMGAECNQTIKQVYTRTALAVASI